MNLSSSRSASGFWAQGTRLGPSWPLSPSGQLARRRQRRTRDISKSHRSSLSQSMLRTIQLRASQFSPTETLCCPAPTVGHRSSPDTGWSHTCRHRNTWGGKPGGVSLRQPAGVTWRLNRVNFFFKCCQTFNQSWQDFGKTPDEQNSALSCLLQL